MIPSHYEAADTSLKFGKVPLIDMSPKSSKHVAPSDILESRCEVARRIGCHPKTIQRAERRGELLPIKFNARLVRYRRSEVDAWIANAQA